MTYASNFPYAIQRLEQSFWNVWGDKNIEIVRAIHLRGLHLRRQFVFKHRNLLDARNVVAPFESHHLQGIEILDGKIEFFQCRHQQGTGLFYPLYVFSELE